MPDTPTLPVPNHHAHYPAFAGLSGLVAAASMLFGRQPTARLAADLVDLQAGEPLVDIGCGTGAGVREAARRGAIVTGVDPAAVMLRVARCIPRRGRVAWRHGAAEALPLEDGSASVVWSISAVHHWDDVAGGLDEVRRVLRPGGRLLAMERRIRSGSSGLASHGWSPPQAESFAAACRAAGLDDVTVSAHDVGESVFLAVLASRRERAHEAGPAHSSRDS